MSLVLFYIAFYIACFFSFNSSFLNYIFKLEESYYYGFSLVITGIFFLIAGSINLEVFSITSSYVVLLWLITFFVDCRRLKNEN